MEISDNEAQTAGTVETLGCNTRDTLSEAAMGEIIEACGYHSLDDIRSVLLRYRIDVNNFTLNNYGMTLFHLSALGRIDLLKMLILEYNGQVNVVNSRHETPLHLAAHFGHDTAVFILLQFGSAQVDAFDEGGNTPLHLAAKRGHSKVIEVLLIFSSQSEDTPNSERKTPLDIASGKGYAEATMLLGGNVDQVSSSSNLSSEMFDKLIEDSLKQRKADLVQTLVSRRNQTTLGRKVDQLLEHTEGSSPRYPGQYVCPITQDIMVDPAVASDGITYDRCAIWRWLSSSDKSPVTGSQLRSFLVYTNQLIRSQIEDWVDSQLQSVQSQQQQ